MCVILLADFLPARWDGRALVVSPRSLCASSNPNIHPQARLMELNYPPEWGERQIAGLHVPCCIYKCALWSKLLLCCVRARLIHDRKKSCLTEIANKAARTETARRAPTTDITLACAFVSLKAISQRIHQQRIMSLAAKTDLCFSSP